MLATIIGFTAAMVLGTAIAAALWWWQGLYRVLDPYLVVANAMPKTAFVPIFYIWLGATLSIYGMSLAISLFVTILMIYNGFQGTDPNKVKLAQTFGATKAQILAKVVLPGSVPTLIAALKVNVGLSLVGVVVGEFQSANLGLGYLIQYGSQIFKLNIVMTAITILAMVSSRDVSRDLVAGSCGDAVAIRRLARSARRLAFLSGRLGARPANALDRRDGRPRLLGDDPVLFLDRGARGLVPVEASEDFSGNPAIGPLRAVFIEHVEQDEFGSRCRFSRHCGLLFFLQRRFALS